ncbi:MAG: cobyric acid synthase, partial [Aestuariivirgaceae bacterium]
DCARPFATIDGKPDGAISPDGRIAGTYMHGSFTADGFRRAYLSRLGADAADVNFSAATDKVLDDLADHLNTHLDTDRILDLAGPVQ